MTLVHTDQYLVHVRLDVRFGQYDGAVLEHLTEIRVQELVHNVDGRVLCNENVDQLVATLSIHSQICLLSF